MPLKWKSITRQPCLLDVLKFAKTCHSLIPALHGQHCTAPVLIPVGTRTVSPSHLCRNRQHCCLQEVLDVLCRISEVRTRLRNDTPEWVVNGNLSSLLHLKIGVLISCLIMLMFLWGTF